jgi:hypothetical protein
MTILVERKLGLGDVVARLRIRQEAFGAGADPFDRTAGQLGGVAAHRDFVEHRRLHAEAAAGVAGDDANIAFRHFEHPRHLGAIAVRPLSGGVDGEAPIPRRVVRDRAARLHGHRGHPVDDKAVLDDMGGLGEAGLARRLVADQFGESDVVRTVLEDARRVRLDCVFRGYDRRQFLVISLDQLGGIERLRDRLGDDKNDRIADPAHAILGQHGVARLVHWRAVAALEPGMRREVAKPGGFPVRAGDDGEHAGRRLRRFDIERLDFGVAVRRAHHDAIGHARKLHIVGVAAATAHQPRILETRHALTDRKLAHSRNDLVREPSRGGEARRRAARNR